MLQWVTTYYLETLDPAELKSSADRDVAVALDIKRQPPSGQRNQRFYREVGADWQWIDRLPWTDDEWEAYARRPGLDTYVGSEAGLEIGYFELDTQAQGHVEIAYFGLLPNAIGRGLGRRFLVAAIEQAWQSGARRVWVHTCTLDHPRALANYQARGMRLYKQESCWKAV